MHKLSELGDLWTGYQLRSEDRKEEAEEVGSHFVIQLGDVGEGDIDPSRLHSENLGRARKRDQVRAGDILLRSRGASYRAALVPECPPNTVAIAPLFVLRLTRPGVMPEYIAWYINRPAAQAQLAAQASGSYIPSVSVQAFSNMEVVLPPLEAQRRITHADALLRQENTLTRQLMQHRERLVQTQLEAFLETFASD